MLAGWVSGLRTILSPERPGFDTLGPGYGIACGEYVFLQKSTVPNHSKTT